MKCRFLAEKQILFHLYFLSLSEMPYIQNHDDWPGFSCSITAFAPEIKQMCCVCVYLLPSSLLNSLFPLRTLFHLIACRHNSILGRSYSAIYFPPKIRHLLEVPERSRRLLNLINCQMGILPWAVCLPRVRKKRQHPVVGHILFLTLPHLCHFFHDEVPNKSKDRY